MTDKTGMYLGGTATALGVVGIGFGVGALSHVFINKDNITTNKAAIAVLAKQVVDIGTGGGAKSTSAKSNTASSLGFRGPFNTTTIYKVGDVISGGDGMYLCVQNGVGVPLTDSTRFHKLTSTTPPRTSLPPAVATHTTARENTDTVAQQPSLNVKGTWRSSVAYSPGDIVHRDGNSYVVRTPSSSASFKADDFALLSHQGKQGKAGLVFKNTWHPRKSYESGDVVVDDRDGLPYVARGNATGTRPSESTQNWTAMLRAPLRVDCPHEATHQTCNHSGKWLVNKHYCVNGIAVHQGNTYMCTTDHKSTVATNPTLEDSHDTTGLPWILIAQHPTNSNSHLTLKLAPLSDKELTHNTPLLFGGVDDDTLAHRSTINVVGKDNLHGVESICGARSSLADGKMSFGSNMVKLHTGTVSHVSVGNTTVDIGGVGVNLVSQTEMNVSTNQFALTTVGKLDISSRNRINVKSTSLTFNTKGDIQLNSKNVKLTGVTVFERPPVIPVVGTGADLINLGEVPDGSVCFCQETSRLMTKVGDKWM
jgi:hypothetical protein